MSNAERAWGGDAIIVRRPEAGDSILQNINVLKDESDVKDLVEAFRRLHLKHLDAQKREVE
jgi:hypothetical protein